MEKPMTTEENETTDTLPVIENTSELTAETTPVMEVPVISVAPVVVKNVEVKPITINTSVTNDFSSVFEKMRQSGTVYEKMTMASLDFYVAKMQPGFPVSPEDGARQQYGLWKLFETLLEGAPEAEFKKLWSVLLAYVHQNINGVFNDRYVYRFADQWVWGLDELSNMQRVINLVITTCNPATRKDDVRRVSISRTFAEGFSEKAKQRIANYYNS
jgi:hypothetical protein